MYQPMVQFYCLKHFPRQRTHLQWMCNEMRKLGESSLIPVSYLHRLPKMLCNCQPDWRADVQTGPQVEDPWENVSEGQRKEAYDYVQNYVEMNRGDPNADIVRKFLEKLHLPDYTSSDQNYHKSSVSQLFVILQKAFEGNFSFLEPPSRRNAELDPLKEEKSLTFDLDGFNYEYIGILIGANGKELRKFLSQYKCHVKVNKLQDGNSYRVVATVTKKAATMETLERIRDHFIQLANDVQEAEDNYQKSREERVKEKKKNFRELLSETEGMGAYTDWATILQSMKATQLVPYTYLNKFLKIEEQRKIFEEMKESWIGPPIRREESMSDDSDEITSLKQALVTTARGARPLDSPVQVSSTDQVSASLSLTNQMSASLSSTNQVSASLSSTNHVSSPAQTQASTNHNTAAPVIMATELTRNPTICLVHDRRWAPTFQYMSNQCFLKEGQKRCHTRTLARNVCTCTDPLTDMVTYFVNDQNFKNTFKECIKYINEWEEETHTITLPIVKQMEKYEKAETWHSLLKFVFYLDCMRLKKMQFFEPTAKLPGEGLATPPQPSGQQVTPEASQAQPAPSTSASTSAADIPVTETKQVPTEGATGVTQFKMKNVTREDWNEECFFHGRRRKFVFQCVLNHLHKRHLPVKLNIPFSMAVCCCNENVEFKDYYDSSTSARNDVILLKVVLNNWKGDSKVCVQPLIQELETFIADRCQDIPGSFLKFIYFYKQAHDHKYEKFEEIGKMLKKK